MLFLGQWALGLVFAFKKFTVQDVLELWWLLLLLIGYLVGGLLGSITSSSFYAKGDTATPTKIGAILFTLYLPIKIYCYFKFGIIGLAISISAYFTVSLLAQLSFLRSHFKA